MERMGEQGISHLQNQRTNIHLFYQDAAGLPGGSSGRNSPFYTHPDTQELVDHFEDLIQARQVRETGKARKISDDRWLGGYGRPTPCWITTPWRS